MYVSRKHTFGNGKILNDKWILGKDLRERKKNNNTNRRTQSKQSFEKQTNERMNIHMHDHAEQQS